MQQGKCTNFGNCQKADNSEVISIPDGADMICPSCNQRLSSIRPSQSGSPLMPLIIGVVLLLILGGGFFAIKNMLGGKNGHNAGGGTGANTAPVAKIEGAQGVLGRPLRVGIVYWPGYAGGIFANNGFAPNHDCLYFKKYNLLVQFVDIEDPSAANKAFEKGGPDGVDIVWSTVDYWANNSVGMWNNGTKSHAVMQVDWSQGGDAIVADNSIKRVEDLAGKKVAIVPFTPSHWLLAYTTQNSSMSSDDQKALFNNLVQSDSEEAARDTFVANKVPATVVWEPFVSEALKNRPNSHILVSSAYTKHLIADIMVAQDSFIKQHSDAVKAFVRGWLDGATEANRDQATTVKLLMDNEPPYKQGGEDVTRDGLGKVHLATLADNVEMFGLDGKPAEFDRIFKDAGQTWLRLGYIQNNLPVTDAKDDEFVRDYNNEMHVTVPTETVKPEPPKTHVIASKPVKIQFPTGAAALDPNAKTILDDQVVSLAKSTLGSYIHIEGNTDSQGNPEKNVALSKLRAESVRAYLVSKGIDANRLKAIGNGQNKPVADNSTEDGRARNRRTDIVITHQ